MKVFFLKAEQADELETTETQQVTATSLTQEKVSCIHGCDIETIRPLCNDLHDLEFVTNAGQGEAAAVESVFFTTGEGATCGHQQIDS